MALCNWANRTHVCGAVTFWSIQIRKYALGKVRMPSILRTLTSFFANKFKMDIFVNGVLVSDRLCTLLFVILRYCANGFYMENISTRYP